VITACSLLGRGLPLEKEMRPVEWYLSFHPATFLTIRPQLVDEPWTGYSFVPRSMESILVATLAKFRLVEVNAHGRVSGVLEVEQ
jgi:hypothetical protein